MTASTLSKTFTSGDAETRSVFVGPQSKFVAGLATAGSTGTNFLVRAQIRIMDQWLDISRPIDSPGLVSFPNGLEGNLPAGAEMRVTVRGTYADATVFMMSS